MPGPVSSVRSTATALLRYVTSRAGLQMIGLAACAGWIAAFVFVHIAADRIVSQDDNVLGRDYLAFYVAGTMVLQGQGQHIYDEQAQLATQAEILARYGESRSGFVSYINPASVAVAYSLLARLGYLPAFFLHTALMTACFVGGMWLLKSHTPHIAPAWIPATMVAITFVPLAQAVTGGQNTSLTFLLLALAYRGVVRRQQVLAGLALGLLLYKPQYALPFLGLLLLRRHWITAAVATGLGVGHYVLGALFCGWDWPANMQAYLAGYYDAQELAANGHTHISIVVALRYWIAEPLARAGSARWVPITVEGVVYALVVAIVAYLIWLWRRADTRRDDFGLYWAAVMAAALLISPHTQYYDAGLLIMSVWLTLDGQRAKKGHPTDTQRLLLLAGYLGGGSYLAARWLHFQPLVLWPVLVFWWADRLIRQRAKS